MADDGDSNTSDSDTGVITVDAASASSASHAGAPAVSLDSLLSCDGKPVKFVDTSSGAYNVVRHLVARQTRTEVGELSLLDVLAAYYYIFCHIRDPAKLCEVLRTGHSLYCVPDPEGGTVGIREVGEDSNDEVCVGKVAGDDCTRNGILASSSCSSSSPCPEKLVIPAGLE